MNGAHLHLLLSHAPVFGLLIGLTLLAAAMARRDHQLLTAALVGLVVSGVIVVATFLSGDGAREIIERLPRIEEPSIERHRASALDATVAGGALGLASLIGLFQLRRRGDLAAWLKLTIVLLAVTVLAALTWTSSHGGAIRHTEIAANAQPPAAAYCGMCDYGTNARSGVRS